MSSPGIADQLARRLQVLGRPVRLMEVCGTHTVAISRSGLRSLLPPGLELLSGPGCPVCVTPVAYVDQAVSLAESGCWVATFGDMLRVPGSAKSLEQARAEGAVVKVVYSPLDALAWAEAHPQARIVFLGVGFETTAPTVGVTIQTAASRGVKNFQVLSGHKTIPRAMAALLRQGDVQIDGFLCPGHVSVILGSRPYEFIPREFGIPCVIAGFEPQDILQAVGMLLDQIAARRPTVENQYRRSVREAGNPAALAAMATVFAESDAVWRGLGVIPATGLAIRSAFAAQNAASLLPASLAPAREHPGCRCGDVLRGALLPTQCPLFRSACSPARPLGACMVSSEGACAAYFKYHAEDSGAPAVKEP